MKAEQKYNNDQSNDNKKIFDDLSVEAAKKKIEVDELLNFFGMKNLLQDTIRLQLTKSKFSRPFEISAEINGEYSDKKSQCDIEVERLSKAKKGIHPGMKRCIGAIDDILISLSPKIHKDLMQEAIAYKETHGHMGDYYYTLICVVDYRLELLAGKECVGITGLRSQYYNPLFIDSSYSYDRSYLVEESKELLPLLLHPDQFCDLAMIVPELRNEIKEKYEDKYKDDEEKKSFNERCLWNLLNKSYLKNNYSKYEADIENPNVLTGYDGSGGINEHSLGGILTELKNNPVNNEDREYVIKMLCKHFPERAPEIERHAKYPVQQLFTEKIKNEDKQMKGQEL